MLCWVAGNSQAYSAGTLVSLHQLLLMLRSGQPTGMCRATACDFVMSKPIPHVAESLTPIFLATAKKPKKLSIKVSVTRVRARWVTEISCDFPDMSLLIWAWEKPF